jgi:transposase
MTDTAAEPFAALVAFDWADQKHAGALQTPDGKTESFELEQSSAPIDLWATKLRERFAGKPIAVCLEQSKGALIYALMKYDFFILYPINPKQLSRFRDAIYPSGSKDDPSDADLLLELLSKHRDRLHPWRPDDETTRLIGQLSQDRRNLVDQRTKFTNAMKSRLKQYFPLALEVLGELDCELACQFLLRWSSLAPLQLEDPQQVAKFYRKMHCYHPELIEQRLEKIAGAMPLVTDEAIVISGEMMVQTLASQLLSLIARLKQYDLKIAKLMTRHPDAEIFKSFPGAGAALAPRLLAAFGTDRERLGSADEMQRLSGIAPVTVKSGKSSYVHRRWACNKYLRQTFHEFALHSLLKSAWAKAYYDMMCARGANHHAAVRALAFKWIRIIQRCWRTRTRYDEAKYFQTLRERNSPILAYMAASS